MKTILHDILARRDDISPLTRKAEARAIDQFVAFAGTDPQRWTMQAGQAFYDQMLARGMKNGARIVMSHLTYVSKWFAKKHGGQHFADVQMRAMAPSPKRLHLEPEEAYELLLTTTETNNRIDVRDRLLIVTALETGMRSMSLRGMGWNGINKHMRGYPYARVPIKGRGGTEVFDVPLSDVTMKALAYARARLPKSDGVFVGYIPTIGSATDSRTAQAIAFKPQRLNVSSTFVALSHASIYKIIKTRAATAGIRHVHPHLLRHTFITWRAQAGAPLSHVAAITGHSIEKQLLNNPKWGELPRYLDLTAVADEARNRTPEWLAGFVDQYMS